MKKSFSSRRVPRKIGAEDEEEDIAGGQATARHEPTFKRPTIGAKKSSQARRVGAAIDDEDDAATGVRTPKRAGLSRIAIQRNGGQRSSFRASDLSQSEKGDEAPTYSAADLQALKDSTPKTPAEPVIAHDQPDSLAVQVSNKFGTDLSRYDQAAAIPSATEIAEKKARRARLALEQQADEYISLDPDDPGWEEDEDGNVMRDMDGRLVLRDKDRYGIQESRLVRDDEDIMEGFDEFTGQASSRIIMGESAKPTDDRARKDEISRQIAEAEATSDVEEDDDDERARNAAFEAAQTRHGTFTTDSASKYDKYAAFRAKTPPIITPIPTLDDVIKRFKQSVLDLETRKREKEAEMLHLSEEKLKLKEEEERVQRQLKEVAEKYRRIKIEKGFLPREDNSTTTQAVTNGHTTNEDKSLGADIEESELPANTGLGASSVTQTRQVDEDGSEEEERPHLGLGLGAPAAGLGWS